MVEMPWLSVIIPVFNEADSLLLVGGVLLFVYALHRRDPVFAIGQGAGLLVYTRNLYLLFGRGPRPANVAR
jgi:lipid-A-disaccharide synthase-like uncharacterized protein